MRLSLLRLRRRVRHRAGPAAAPLLSKQELLGLRERIRRLGGLPFPPREAQEPWRGERLSRRPGSGYEFEEMRPYQPGDDVRSIDWQVTARTGEPHVRVHLEERRISRQLVIDRGAGMRFATRGRLKLAQAAQAGAALAFHAEQQQMPLGLTLLDETPQHHPPAIGSAAIQAALAAMAAPAPPAEAFPLAWSRLPEWLLPLAAGSEVAVISDFHGCSDDDLDALLALAGRLSLLLVRITDPVEDELPALGRVAFMDLKGRRRTVDTASARLRQDYARGRAEARQRFAQRVLAAGARLVSLRTTDDPLLCLQQPGGCHG